MGVIGTSSDGISIDTRRPGAGMTTVVGERRHGVAEAGVAGPAEADREMLARASRDRRHARQGGHRFGSVVGFPTVAPLGEHLGGVDLPRSWQRAEDHGVRVLAQMGHDRAVELPQRVVQGLDDPDHREHHVPPGAGLRSSGQSRRCGAQSLEQLRRGTSPAVAVPLEEHGHAGLPETGRRGRRRVAGQEGKADLLVTSAKSPSAPGQAAARVARSWLPAATRASTSSLRERTTRAAPGTPR